MVKVKFLFDKEKDLYNIWETCNKTSSWSNHKKNVSSTFLKICEGKRFDECKKELENYRIKLDNSGLIEIFVDAVQKAWDKINDKYFERLQEIMKDKFKFKSADAYITTVGRCPYHYGKPWFMVSFFSGIAHALKTSGHELMHIQFHNTYWNKIEKQIGEEKTADLKEALTVLLNLEFKDLWFVDDRGYETHKKLREFITIEWEKEKDFEKLLNKCIKYLKK